MKKLILSIKKHPTSYIVSFIIALVLGLIPLLTVYFVQGRTIYAAFNGVGYSLLGVFFLAILMWLANAGTYDILVYGFSQMFTSMFSHNPNKYHDYVSYKDDKNSKREIGPRYYVSFLAASILYAILTLILYICYKM